MFTLNLFDYLSATPLLAIRVVETVRDVDHRAISSSPALALQVQYIEIFTTHWSATC